MFKTKIIYRFISLLLIFSLMIIVPYSFNMIRQVQKMIQEEEKIEEVHSEEYRDMHKEFSSRLLEQMVPFVFYVFILAFMMSILFLRTILISLKALREGSIEMKNGNLDIRLPILNEDEIGDATKAFNDMAATLRDKTAELTQKDIYIKAMLDALWVVDEEDRLIDINPAFTKLFGYTKEEVLGISAFDLLDEKNAAILRKQLEEKRSKGESSIYELSILAKNGTPIPVLVSGSPIYENDRFIGKIGILKDFREQISLRNDLQQSLDYIETIMNSIPDELVVIDRNFRIVMANSIATARSGGNITGAYCHSVLHASDTPCWSNGNECPTRMVFSTGKHHRYIHKHTDSEHRIKYHEILASPVLDQAGNIQHVIELLRDVTDTIKDEELILRKNRELTTLNNISGILSKSLKPDEIFSKVLHKIIEMLNMDGGGIYFMDESAKELTCRYHKGISEDHVKMLGRIRLGDDIPGKVAITGQIFTSVDILHDEKAERSLIKHSGIRGYCCIPIKGKERIIGVFCLFSFTPHAFSSDEETILYAIGEMTGIALENIKLYEKMRTMFENQRKRWHIEHQQLRTLSSNLGAATDISDIISNVLSIMKQMFAADFIWILSPDGAGNLNIKFSTETDLGQNRLIYASEMSSLEKYTISKNHPTIVADIRSEEKFYMAEEVSTYQTAVSIPMFIGDKPLGACTFYFSIRRDFREEDIHFMETVINMISVALERSDFYIRAGKEKELADTILHSVNDGIITLDTSDRIISVNNAFERITGVRHERAVALQVCDVFRFSDNNISFRLVLGECVEEARKGNTVTRSSSLATRYGNIVPVTITSSPIIDKNGAVTGIVNLIRDISREKELDRMKTEIVRSVSHEFRTPLSAIVGMTEMLLSGDVEGAKVEKYLSIIRSEGLRLSKMVTELLNIARIESGKETIRLEAFRIDDLFMQIKESIMPLADKKKAIIRFNTGGLESIIADMEKLKELLINFIDNSLTYSDEGCIIDVHAYRNNDTLSIAVADNGWGIPEEDIPHVGERFYRGRNAERVKGTGLGLALCIELLKMHDGNLQIERRPEGGTLITMSIPYREEI